MASVIPMAYNPRNAGARKFVTPSGDFFLPRMRKNAAVKSAPRRL